VVNGEWYCLVDIVVPCEIFNAAIYASGNQNATWTLILISASAGPKWDFHQKFRPWRRRYQTNFAFTSVIFDDRSTTVNGPFRGKHRKPDSFHLD
jgi:hypothetical protein